MVLQRNELRCLRRIWLGWVSCMSISYIKSIPTHEKLFAVGKSGLNAKVAQMSRITIFFSRVGLALGWGVRRFYNIYLVPGTLVYVFRPSRIC